MCSSDLMPETMADLLAILEPFAHNADYQPFALIELVHSSPQMGVKSAFTFGQGFGRLEMAFSACRIPFDYVRPQVWQKALGCLTKGDKSVTKAKAQQLFPHLKCTHKISDALLIAEYNRRTHQ